MHRNLKDFIARLDSAGELIRIKVPVSTIYEITEITDRVSKSPDGGKALLFENTDTNFPLVINLLGSEKRMAMAAGVESLEHLTERVDSLLREATSPKNSLWDKLRTLPMLADVAKWLPKVSSSRGECQQVILKGSEARLSLLPILKCWSYDGGRFVTLPMVNTIDPDNGVRNMGMYRMQVMDDFTTGMHWHIHKTGARHYESYKRRGERMPVSIALGGDPAYTYAATAPMPDNMDEYLLAGFLRERSVKLVKSITNDIYVPSDCDFVIEGYVDPSQEKVIEGPFGDHTGFYSLQDRYPLFHVMAITHRRDAIYPATIVGVPPQEDAYIAIATERIFLSPIRFVMQPETCDMWMPPAGVAHNLAIASIECRYAGQGNKVVASMWGAGQMMFNKYLVITPSNIDIRNPKQLAEVVRRVDLSRYTMRSEGVLDVLDHATATNGFGGKLAINATEVDLTRELHPQWSGIPEGVVVNSDFVEQWGALVLFAGDDCSLDDVEVEDVNFVVVLDSAAQNMSGSDIVWLATGNSDPRRDVELKGATLFVDGRSKRPGMEGNPSRFPNVVTSSPETIELVDSRWAEYGVGEFVESPSLKYRELILSDREDW